MNGADLDLSIAHYRALAASYDRKTRRIDAVRERAIQALSLRPGEIVLDAACGTGWCIPRLAERVGATGRIIAFDASETMLALARQRSAACPVDIYQATAAEARLPVPADAVLLSYTHDMLRSPRALDNVLSQVKPGARVVATSTKLYASWLAPANWYLRWSHRDYITDFEGLEAPWSILATRLADFRVRTGPLTQHYVASGTVRGGQAA
jgi:ubiquinone/menaquinone biosynthesis C-methylase UbiE